MVTSAILPPPVCKLTSDLARVRVELDRTAKLMHRCIIPRLAFRFWRRCDLDDRGRHRTKRDAESEMGRGELSDLRRFDPWLLAAGNLNQINARQSTTVRN